MACVVIKVEQHCTDKMERDRIAYTLSGRLSGGVIDSDSILLIDCYVTRAGSSQH